MLTITVDTSEGRRRFGLLTDSLKDLGPVLREFDKYKRAKIDEVFTTEGHGQWPERSERSQERGWTRAMAQAARAPTSLLRKLHRERGRAAFRLASGKGKANTVARRAAVLAEYERQMESGDFHLEGFQHEDKRLAKSVQGLGARLGRAQARAQEKGKILGNVPRTIRSTIRGGQLVIDSSWDSPAPAVLNDGGKVGRGATVPPREFLAWDASDGEYLRILLKERALLAWEA